MEETKQKIIDEIVNSGAKHVRTAVSVESCAVEIAIRDIEDIDCLPDNFWWKEMSTGLDEEDY